MLFIEGKVDIFLSGPKNTVEVVCKRTLRILIPECDQSNNGFQDQYGNPLSLHETLHLMFDILLELQQTKHRRSFFLVRRAKPARQENDQSAALVFRALGARARVHFSH